MPPRGHSSSSRSSSSRSSSSRSSSSRSSSSRSSFSRSSSSHSSSSRSSSSYSGRSTSRSSGMRGAGALGSGLLLSRGPSSHSTSSHSSRPVRSGPRREPRPSGESRARYNQPSGFRPTGGGAPSYHYGRRHDYIFFPAAWTDESTGTRYEGGYYDENGTRYENVAFEQDGTYNNVVCHCAYCGHDTIVNLNADSVASFDLKCPDCGAPMEIASELDEYKELQTDTWEQPVRRKKSWKRRLLILAAVLVALEAYGLYLNRKPASNPVSSIGGGASSGGGAAPAVDLTSDTIRLAQTGDQSYVVDDRSGDKELVWDSAADSYYDETTDCWLWYNTDVEPPVWQYWYEGISSDFADSGWMEHDASGWYIEESAGNWIDLPSDYDTSGLWYIE